MFIRSGIIFPGDLRLNKKFFNKPIQHRGVCHLSPMDLVAQVEKLWLIPA
jgi:hypothetical protein